MIRTKGDDSSVNTVQVSIICCTYNHEDYIAEAVKSFLMQRTSFPFEILIHDNASTDNTTDILKQLESKYPKQLKVIYQEENQYVKAIDINFELAKQAKGKYIAYCQGDDFWTDPNKLQKQFHFMESHPSYSLCVHAGNIVRSFDKKELAHNQLSDWNKTFTTSEIIEGGRGLFLTNSMFFRKSWLNEKPLFLQNAPVGDYPLAIYLALKGKVYYIADRMSSYRVEVEGSWTMSNLANAEGYRQHFIETEKMLDELDTYTNGRYKPSIDLRKSWDEIVVSVKERNFEKLKSKELQEAYKLLPFNRKTAILIEQYLPKLFHYLKERRRWLVWMLK